MSRKGFGRRKFLLGSAGLLAGGAGVAWWGRRPLAERLMRVVNGNNPNVELTASPDRLEIPCLVTTRLEEGPFYFPSLERRNVTEDRVGRPLDLRLQLTRHPECGPLANAVVEIWHCDAEGIYSGYPDEISHDAWQALVFFVNRAKKRPNGELHVEPQTKTTFLRGLQRTDEGGWVEFRTIFPGWYMGRVPHIHVRAATEEGERLTTQLFFEPALHDRLYVGTPPYDRFGRCPTTFQTDGVLAKTKSRVEGVLVKAAWRDQGPVDAVARIGLQRG